MDRLDRVGAMRISIGALIILALGIIFLVAAAMAYSAGRNLIDKPETFYDIGTGLGYQTYAIILAICGAVVTFFGVAGLIAFARGYGPKSPTIQRNLATDDKSTANTTKTRVIGAVSCEYCGTLMSQTTTNCPHCGAPRKE
jgi:hypothetical protein